ncbi:MAG TPA: bifunctional 5,10-methylenetetrahydrofolate dehydrogenase/5,10-methenyltetrahydrofolate cyclohydrolase [Elusimicrobiota bacterium]|nr:bifunctional 5,10-methylenetetrahydrofolate dehydrogenase/5,10-methenyltetrahydrofolate cyclohydrolase [Elusimicrobiota bacterium]
MKGHLLRGKDPADALRKAARERAARLTDSRGTPPRLAVLAIGGDEAAQVYLRSKLSACRETGIESTVESLPKDATPDEALRVLAGLSHDAEVDGILIDLPLPPHLDARVLTDAIAPEKDAEGVTPVSLGRLYREKSMDGIERSALLVPCTARAVVHLACEGLAAAGLGSPSGLEAVVLGRSNIVGRPAAHLLSCLDATVTLAHSRTKDLPQVLRRADIVVAAAGSPGLVRGDWIKEGAVVVDAGITRQGHLIRGDVEFEAAAARAGAITPVPGGVGPLTVAYLLQNVVLAAERAAERAG